jgi:hypothetical protein
MGRAHHHAVARGEMTGRRGPTLSLDVNEARAARAQRGAVRVLAELRQRDLERVDRVEDGRPRRDLDLTTIDDHSHLIPGTSLFSVSLAGETFRDIFDAPRPRVKEKRATAYAAARHNGGRGVPPTNRMRKEANVARAGATILDSGDRFPDLTFPTVAHGRLTLPEAFGDAWGVFLVYRGHW